MALLFTTFDYSPEHYRLAVDLHNSHWMKYPRTIEELLTLDQTRPAQHVQYRWFIYLKDHAIGLIDIEKAEWSPDAHRFECSIIILPAHRRRGYGSAALKHAILVSNKSHQIKTLESEANTLDPDGMHFLRNHGFVIRTHEYVSVLDLKGFDSAPGVQSEGIRNFSYASLVDSDRAFWEKLYALHAHLDHDVPWHEVVVMEPFETWKRRRLSDPVMLFEAGFVAVDGTGEFIGLTELFKRPGQDTYLYTGLTGVKKEFRRQGIARALKVLSLQWAKTHLRTSSGAHYQVLTENEKNNPMFVLNQHLGFRKFFEIQYCTKTVNPS